MAKKKQNATVRPTPVEESLPWGLYVMLALFVAIIIAPIVINVVKTPKASATKQVVKRPEPLPVVQQESVEDMMAWQNTHDQFLARITLAAERAAKGDTYAEGLVKAFREQVRPARIQMGGSYRIMLGGSVPEQIPFPIVIVDKNERHLLDHRPRAVFSFSEDAFIFLAYDKWQDWYLGVVALHEMVHWDDKVLSKRESYNSHGAEWTHGEVRAHEVENAALDRITGGKFLASIQEVIADPARCQPVRDQSFCWPKESELDRLQEMWQDKPLSMEEAANRGGSITVALVLQQAKSESQKLAAYDWVLRTKADTKL